MNKPIIFKLLYIVFLITSYQSKGQSIQLNYPYNGYVNSKNSIELCWNYTAGHAYEIEVSNLQNFSNIFFSASNLNVRKIVIPNLVTNTVYYWRVRSTTPLLTPWSYVNHFKQFSPSTVNNLSLWLRADTLVTMNGNNVLTWGDLSSNQYAVTQATMANQPTIIQNFCINHSAVKFDGNDAFEIPSFNYGASNSVFIVSKKNAGASGGRYIGCYNNEMEIATDLALVSTNVLGYYTTTSPSLLSLVRTVTPSSLYLNDSLIGSTIVSIPPLIAGGFYIGRSYSNSALGYLTGEIAEIIICSTQLNDSLIHLTNDYLMDKYSAILSLGNDTMIADNFCPITLSPNNGFSNFLWSTGDTTSSISTNISGQYWLRATDYFGRIMYDTINVQFPIVNQLPSQSLCYGSQLIWNSGLNAAFTHHWQDASSQNQISITNQGQYFFTVTDSYGCTFASDTSTISVDNFSIENSLGNDTSLCSGNTIQLQNNPSLLLNYLWSTGSNNDSLVILNSGQFWVEISNENNCILRDTINIIIVGTAPNAQFSAGNACLGAALNFTDLSIPPSGQTISQWLWDFGDGSISTNQNNSHIYDSIGTYLVSLKVLLPTGCGAVTSQLLNVFNTPEINFTTFNLCNENLTEFNDISNLYGGSLQSVLWNFGDTPGPGNVSNTPQAFHNYHSPGNYIVQLTLATLEGCVDSIQTSINIKASPIANFSANHLCIDEPTEFTDISQINFPWQNMNRIWYFPNGDTAMVYQTSFIFDTSGVYPITLYVQSSNGCSDTLTKNITVFHQPEAHFTFEKNCLGTPTQFTDSSLCVNCQIDNYKWYIDDELVGQNSNMLHLFNDTGSYLIRLEVQNNAGCKSSIDTIVSVSPAPISNFVINSNYGSPPFLAEFTNLSENATSFFWDFGEGNYSTLFNPSHNFIDTGTFVINLKAFNSNNCVHNSAQLLKLIPKRIDLLAFKLETSLIDNFIECKLTVFNKSSTIVTGFEMNITNKSSLVLKENYENNILPGEFKSIKLNTKIQQGDGMSLSDVICVEIINVKEGIDEDQSNNSLCNALQTNEFKLLNIFPNPSNENIVLNFIAPSKEEMSYSIYDLTGHKLDENIIYSQVGFNQFHIQTSLLAAGSYICKLSNKGNVQSLMFVKLNKD